MKILIRKNAFETNSSSTHSICVGSTVNIGKEIFEKFSNKESHPYTVGQGEYGWEYEEYDSFADKLDYIFIYLESSRRDEEHCRYSEINFEEIPDYLRGGTKFMDWLSDYFNSYGLEFHWKLKPVGKYGGGYIDHQSVGRGNDMEEILSSKQSILNYLFNEEVYVQTDNDNH